MIIDHRSKWLWAITIANIVVACGLVLVIYGMMLAMAVLAPVISSWPLFILIVLSLGLSIVGLTFAKGVSSRMARGLSLVINGCALAFDVLIISVLAMQFRGITRERFLIPEGYKGDIAVLYGVPNEPSLKKTGGVLTFEIPEDGILRTRDEMLLGPTRTQYYYQQPDGSLERIGNFWPTTINPTPENLANDRDLGVYFPRSGRVTNSTGCSVQFEEFYVGTKANLLSKYRKETDLDRYLNNYPGTCSK